MIPAVLSAPDFLLFLLGTEFLPSLWVTHSMKLGEAEFSSPTHHPSSHRGGCATQAWPIESRALSHSGLSKDGLLGEQGNRALYLRECISLLLMRLELQGHLGYQRLLEDGATRETQRYPKSLSQVTQQAEAEHRVPWA